MPAGRPETQKRELGIGIVAPSPEEAGTSVPPSPRATPRISGDNR